MELDYQVILKGMPEELATEIGGSVAKMIANVKANSEDLDLRRVERIIITTEFATELQELTKSTASGNPILHTNEEYAVAVAKILLLPKAGDDGFEIVPVIDANVVAILALGDPEKDAEGINYVTHLLHHELVHVHDDDNKKIDAFYNEMLKTQYAGICSLGHLPRHAGLNM